MHINDISKNLHCKCILGLKKAVLLVVEQLPFTSTLDI